VVELELVDGGGLDLGRDRGRPVDANPDAT
jgi:hypothetical protein